MTETDYALIDHLIHNYNYSQVQWKLHNDIPVQGRELFFVADDYKIHHGEYYGDRFISNYNDLYDTVLYWVYEEDIPLPDINYTIHGT